ncbi:MAG: DUF2752 domain-containing protein [Micrococcales bacterium]
MRSGGFRFSGEQLALGATGIATLSAVALLPHEFWPKCPVYLVTGLYCPGCGGLRATWDLLHGNLYGALNQNALIFVIPVFVILGFVAQRSNSRLFRIAVLAVILTVAIGFTVLRNLPGSWLAPDPFGY